MSVNKKAYFQGTEEPTPGRKKYKSDPALVVQPRFKKPFYRNYDLYTIPGMEDVGPGTGWHSLQNYKSVQDFLKDRRKRLQPRYVADDSWQIDSGKKVKKNPDRKARMTILERIIKQAADENDGPNFDYGHGAYDAMNKGEKMKSITDFKRESPGAFFADDNADHMLPPKEHGTSIYDWKNSPYQGTPSAKKKKDSNDIDFPIDEEVNHQGEMVYPGEENYQAPKHLVGPAGPPGDINTYPGDVGPTDQSSYINSAQIAGEHSYLPKSDEESRSDEALDFGRDYTDETLLGRPSGSGESLSDEMQDDDKEMDLDALEAKYLGSTEIGLFGLPDGVDPEGHDADQTEQIEQPYTGTSDISREMYDDKWNI